MKILKKVLIGFLVLLLINLIGLLVISFNLKNILVDGIMKETVKTELLSKNYDGGSYTIPDEEISKITDDEKVKEMLNSKEVQDLLNKYLDTTIDTLLDEDNIDEIEIEKDMANFLKENREVLEEAYGVTITDEMIDEAESKIESKDMSKSFKQSLINTKNNMTDREKTVLKGYKFLISLKFKILLFILCIIDLLLIAIIKKSFYKWIKNLGEALIISGIGVILMSIVVNIIIRSLSPLKEFNTSSLINSGIILILSGIVISIVYYLLTKLISSRKENINDISQISTE